MAAESGCSLHCLNSLNSLICHPSMHAPSLASGLFVESDGLVGVGGLCGSHSGDACWSGTTRMDGLQHAGIQAVSACLNSLIREHTECHGSSCGQLCSSPNSRVVRGPLLRGGTKEQVRQGAGGKACFCSATVRQDACRGKEIMARCAVSGFSPRTFFVTPVLPGPDSDIRMKMGWTVLEKTRNSGVWFFWAVEGLLGCGVWMGLIGAVDWVRKGSYHTAWATLGGSLCTCSYA